VSYSPFSVSFEFQHNVCGRSIYAEGTIDAAIFLRGKVCRCFILVVSQYSCKDTEIDGLSHFSNFRYNQRIVREYTIWMMSCEKDTCDGFFFEG
jgi:hypothetical protein